MIDQFNEVTVETIEVSEKGKRIAHWLIPATLPFNEFIKMVNEKEKTKKIIIGVEEMSIMAFRKREHKFMNLN